MATIAENIAAKKARETGSTPGVELILGQGAQRIAAAAAALATAADAAKGVVGQLNEEAGRLGLQIANGEDKLAALSAEAAETKRRNKVEVALEFQADQAAAAAKYAKEEGKEIIDVAVLQRERDAARKLNDEFEEQVKKEVSAATQQSAIKHSYEIKSLESDYKAKEATNLATIQSQAATIITLQETINQLRADATAVREAEVKRAQAGSIQNLNVGGGQNR